MGLVYMLSSEHFFEVDAKASCLKGLKYHLHTNSNSWMFTKYAKIFVLYWNTFQAALMGLQMNYDGTYKIKTTWKEIRRFSAIVKYRTSRNILILEKNYEMSNSVQYIDIELLN